MIFVNCPKGKLKLIFFCKSLTSKHQFVMQAENMVLRDAVQAKCPNRLDLLEYICGGNDGGSNAIKIEKKVYEAFISRFYSSYCQSSLEPYF
ncbi:hypothetical protein PPL_03540 [Heterostelium album PN500]|uniref:Uncharacterized protein n=1 Tax=Heterostelium pallidum (strain ATCC 26659 / Pp 5 / PN500) TaxID=670386 RepID=D3B530_HETP5|nr:hypothetical protein PPL_03540 [Heterostelium album PN500]EFA83395.1 hypothetical protein PPL_03540 [Heterostelium album PN500]|eukprot:XP_020435512.1 hypothetical protein PPL_03540 [Heterostelium album PN500]